MAKVDLTIIIPARNEMWLARTVEDVVKNIRGNTEVIIGCDGNWPSPSVKDHPKIHIIYHSEYIGQRAITNEGARLSRAKYLMKVDAHCCFDEGFDVKLMASMEDNWTVVPLMKNFHVFDWVCKKCGDRRYQGPTPTSCPKCDNTTEFERDIKWFAKNNPQSTAYCFDAEPHFQYFRDWKHRPEAKGDITDTMSLQGSCFMVTREKFHELNLCDETFGSWGSQGIEVAVKTWLSGGRVVCNHTTWYGHMFRTQGGDFGFPYDISGRQVDRAKKYARELFFQNKWPKQIYPLSWLIDKFWPVPGWSDDDRMAVREQGKGFEKGNGVTPIAKTKPSTFTKGMCFYTDNQIDPSIINAVQKQLNFCSDGHRLVSVSLKPLNFGQNIVLNLKRGHLAMAKQQLAGIEALDVDIIFMVEHDILYPPCHFDFVPPRDDIFYYNLNWWKVRVGDGQALHFKAKQVSGLCAHRQILLEYFRNRVRMIESGEIGGRRHFEPGSHYNDAYQKLTDKGFDTWWSEIPYVDIRHDTVVTRNIFDPSGYRGRVVDWTMADEIPHWGRTKNRFNEFLQEAVNAK